MLGAASQEWPARGLLPGGHSGVHFSGGPDAAAEAAGAAAGFGTCAGCGSHDGISRCRLDVYPSLVHESACSCFAQMRSLKPLKGSLLHPPARVHSPRPSTCRRPLQSRDAMFGAVPCRGTAAAAETAGHYGRRARGGLRIVFRPLRGEQPRRCARETGGGAGRGSVGRRRSRQHKFGTTRPLTVPHPAPCPAMNG